MNNPTNLKPQQRKTTPSTHHHLTTFTTHPQHQTPHSTPHHTNSIITIIITPYHHHHHQHQLLFTLQHQFLSNKTRVNGVYRFDYPRFSIIWSFLIQVNGREVNLLVPKASVMVQGDCERLMMVMRRLVRDWEAGEGKGEGGWWWWEAMVCVFVDLHCNGEFEVVMMVRFMVLVNEE